MKGYKIKMLRELRNYSQDYMAYRIAISQAAYSKIESEQTKISTDSANKITEILNRLLNYF